MAEIPPGLRAALADRYTIERELGSGGMATVYLAEDLRHGRKVAVKVLRPDLAATMGPDRFAREIRIAAQLQHPHILPLLDSGDARGPDGSGPFLFYVMPYVEGESLRERLSRQGELPVSEAVRILVEVSDALAHAHGRGVVHRDIKPDNVMLTGRHALVTDFGVAKAVSEATGRQTLTTIGVALGTPAYMSPEQAAADPHVDHRADIYALGVMAYEILTGRPPFTGVSPQEVLAAHVTQAPQPVTIRRQACPPALGEVIMKCLSKRAADRYQSATELLHALEPLGTPSGGTTPTTTAPLPAVQLDHWYGHPIRVAALFVLASVAVLGVVYFLTIQLGLPDWVLLGALALLAAGLPIMVLTGLIERRRARLTVTGVTPAAGGLGEWITWKKSIRGGMIAFSVLAVGTVAYTAMRLLGIGPVGTLVASGALKNRDKVVVADFTNRTADSTLGTSVSEAFRIDLAQSPVISLMSSSAVGDALARMGHGPNTPLDPALAREVAVREGGKAVVVGDISPVGKGMVLSARLVSASDGTELVALRETADDDSQILKALDRLSARLRERIGESLRTIRGNEPLDQVTTGSLEALRLYTEGARASDHGELVQAVSLLRQAVTIDSGFAMAWRKLAAALANSRVSTAQATDAATRAYQHRERLTEIERYHTTAYYYWNVDYDPQKAISAYRSILEMAPDDEIAINNLASLLTDQRQYAQAESLAQAGIARGEGGTIFFQLTDPQLALGRDSAARAALDLMRTRDGETGAYHLNHALFANSRGLYDSAEVDHRWIDQHSKEPALLRFAALSRASGAMTQGKLRASESRLRELMSLTEQQGLPQEYLLGAVRLSRAQSLYRKDPSAALRVLEDGLAKHPLASMAAMDRPYELLATAYAVAGQPARARQLMKEYTTLVPPGIQRQSAVRHMADGYIALAEKRPEEALAAFREWWNEESCTTCALPEMGRAFDQAGEPDSALAVYLRAAAAPGYRQSFLVDPINKAYTLRRVGELYEEKGDRDKALEYYGKFTALWKDADPELQPEVREVKGRMAKLAGEQAAQ